MGDVVGALKRIAKQVLVHGVARVAPVSWKWRKPGSLLVLAYHRVLPKDSRARKTEQPGMYVSPETLDMHLSELRQTFELVELGEWLCRAKNGRALPKLGCAITFDDGWRDNYQYALPVLVKHQAPATIFLVSGYIGTAQRYWPNQLMELLFRAFADTGSVSFPKPLREIVEPVLAEARMRGQLRAIDADRIVQCAKGFDEADIRGFVAAASNASGVSNFPPEILSREELAEIAATGLVRFGSHTMTHFRLGGEKSVEVLYREIVGSQKQLEDICGCRVDLFCYPNGETSREATEMVRRHYQGAVSTRKGWHAAWDDAHLIKRIGLHESSSESREWFFTRISGWI